VIFIGLSFNDVVGNLHITSHYT